MLPTSLGRPPCTKWSDAEDLRRSQKATLIRLNGERTQNVGHFKCQRSFQRHSPTTFSYTRLDYSSWKNCLPPSVWQHLSSIIIVAASQIMIGTLIQEAKNRLVSRNLKYKAFQERTDTEMTLSLR